MSRHVREAMIQGFGKHEYSSIPLRVELRIQKDFNLVPVIRNSRFGIQNPRLSWIPSHGAKNGPINRG